MGCRSCTSSSIISFISLYSCSRSKACASESVVVVLRSLDGRHPRKIWLYLLRLKKFVRAKQSGTIQPLCCARILCGGSSRDKTHYDWQILTFYIFYVRLGEATGTKTRVYWCIFSDCETVIPRSPFSVRCRDHWLGIEQVFLFERHLIPKRSRCHGQIVIPK